MGIASMILGIISFFVAFTWFKDFAIIMAVVGLVLGIISLVKKKSKGMAIAGIVLTALAVIIAFASGNGSGGNNGTGVTSDGGTNSKKVSVSVDNVVMEKVAITKAGDFVIKVTNNNEGSVCLSEINTVFKDADGNFALKQHADTSFVVIPANSSTYVYDWGFEKNYAQYPNYEFSCELAYTSDSFVVNGIDITSNNTGSQIAVTLANNSGVTIDNAQVVVVYYEGDEIIGIEHGSSNDITTAGSNSYINVGYPEDSNYREVPFDRYEVYYINASKSYQ